MELQLVSLHYFHPHDLVFNEELLNNSGGDDILCCVCLEPLVLMGAAYNCIDCNFFLHKTCAELRSQIKHPLHRNHSLILLPNSPYPGRFRCDFCGIWSANSVYHCSHCKYDLHLKCALLAGCFIQPGRQNHSFTRLNRSDPFTCNFCGVYTDRWEPNEYVSLDRSPSLCTECHIVVHRKCMSLSHSHTIKIQQHDHSLTHTFFIAEDEYVDLKCGICSAEVNREFGSYCCEECNFISHVNCVQGNKLDGLNSLAPEDRLDEELISWPRIEEDFNVGEDILVQEIYNLGHEHGLTLEVDNELKEPTYCDCCVKPISAPFYRCEKCNFNLHKVCTQLPPEIKHPFHQGHPLTVFSTTVGACRCELCGRLFNGFGYDCTICDWPNIDVRCALVNPFKFNHDGHEHPLNLTLNANTDRCKCSACGSSNSRALLQCNSCSFSMDYWCATLPRTAKHRYDAKHPFELKFCTIDDGTDEYYCDICEEERSQHHWYYNCAKCNYEAHPKCAVGVEPLIKAGRLYRKSSVHHHDLFFERRTKDWLPCNSCGKKCYDLSLECHELDCNFRIHSECIVLWGD